MANCRRRIYTASLITLTSWVITTAIKLSVIPKLGLKAENYTFRQAYCRPISTHHRCRHNFSVHALFKVSKRGFYTWVKLLVLLNGKVNLWLNPQLCISRISSCKSIAYLTFWTCHTCPGLTSKLLPTKIADKFTAWTSVWRFRCTFEMERNDRINNAGNLWICFLTEPL